VCRGTLLKCPLQVSVSCSRRCIPAAIRRANSCKQYMQSCQCKPTARSAETEHKIGRRSQHRVEHSLQMQAYNLLFRLA
jgi:hypothetical protein